MQLIPVSVLWGRSPGQEDKSDLPNLRLLNGIQKTFAAIWFGRDTFVRFSQAVSLRYMVVEHGSDEKLHKSWLELQNALRKTTYFSDRPSFTKSSSNV